MWFYGMEKTVDFYKKPNVLRVDSKRHGKCFSIRWESREVEMV